MAIANEDNLCGTSSLDMPVNFSRSTISWGGESRGVFQLKSLLTICRDHNESESEVIGLGEAVIAGNVYKADGLLKQPAYIFQLVGSTHRQWIYRTYIAPSCELEETESGEGTGGTYDTSGTPLFKEGLQLSLETSPAKYIKDPNLLCDIEDLSSLSAVIHLCAQGEKFVVEFPITHINLQAKDSLWQVETGPALFPVRKNTGKGQTEFVPCFFHFNRLDKVDVFFDYPFGRRSKVMNIPSVLEGVNCQVKLYFL